MVDGFNLALVSPPLYSPSWEDTLGGPASPLPFDLLPDPANVLSGAATPRVNLLRLCD